MTTKRKKTSSGGNKKAAPRRPARAKAAHEAPVAANPYCKKIQHHVDAVYRRLGRQIAKLRAFGLTDEEGGVVATAAAACAGVLKTSQLLAGVPEDWKPARGSITTAPIDVGAVVTFKEKVAAKYAKLIDNGATVIVSSIVDGQLHCRTMSAGTTTSILIPRSHVVRASAA